VTERSPQDELPAAARQLQYDLTYNLPFFSRYALKIKDKAGTLSPFILNKAQEYIHTKLEEQLKTMGKVRALILKGRQQGCSTYVGARFYHKATKSFGKSVFILSHEAKTTEKLFKMVERYHDYCPHFIRPKTDIANRREFAFADVNSDYSIGTAGNDNVGRGTTIQLFHGSEVAAWQNTDEIETGIMQAVPDLPNTEVILESTARGMGNMFYDMCMDAMSGKTDYQLIFVPWFWQEEYKRQVPSDFVLTPEELEYKTAYDLTDEQMAWRRHKIAELKTEWKFRQEYPANPNEAFVVSGESFYRAQAILKARKSKVSDPTAPLIVGLDPARNRDRTVFVFRRGRKVEKYLAFKFQNSENVTSEITQKAAWILEHEPVAMMFIDTGHGWGVIENLQSLGFQSQVMPVNFGGEASDAEQWINKRAEMYCLSRDWLHGETGEVAIPDDDVFHRDLMMIPPEIRSVTNRIQIAAKDQIRKKFRISCDVADAFVLTFSFPVRKSYTDYEREKRKARANTSALRTLSRMREYQKSKG
jgi:hypothetical protein